MGAPSRAATTEEEGGEEGIGAEAEERPDFPCIGPLWLSEVTLALEWPSSPGAFSPCPVPPLLLLHPNPRGGLET